MNFCKKVRAATESERKKSMYALSALRSGLKTGYQLIPASCGISVHVSFQNCGYN